MARPREFDEPAVLDAAILCFWKQGYEATSVRDLAQSMGITGASLYNAFGDKRSLFGRALDRYLDLRMRGFIARHEASGSPRQAIEEFLREAIRRSVEDKDRRGCLLVNSSLELAPHDPECREVIDAALSEIEGFFLRCVTRGQQDGTIAATRSPDDVAKALFGILLGLRVMARVRPERAVLEGMVSPVLSLLEK